jgi:ADP-ribosyl-[dinitrogen reductase] hydrolase
MLGVSFARNAVEINGKTAEYYSAPGKCRHFCSVCGSSLFFTFDNSPERVEIMAGVLDTHDFIKPTHHLYTSQAVKCIAIEDALPRYELEIPS